jgi:glycosyltransferase involved in cell wall biosynthesis
LSESRRKVLFLTASYPTPDGPALGVFVKEHARAAALAGFNVAVVHLDRDDVRGLHVEERNDEEFPVVRVRYPRSPRVVSYAGNVAAALAGWRRLRKRSFTPDVVHAHFFLAAVPAILLRPLHRTPVVVTEQWSVFLRDDPATLSPIVRRAAKFALERADLVLPVSEALRDGIRATGIDARFHVVPNVYDPTLFHPPDEAPARDGQARLLAVGAMYEAKGYEFLLDALALLERDARDFHLDIVGLGDLRPRYEEQRHRLGLDERISFLGLRTKDEVARRMREADLFVLTSRYDSNPCAVIEALGSGLPVVATAVGGLPEMIEDGMGLLAEPRDPESIARQISAALDRRDGFDRPAIAERARARYGIEHVAAELADVYEQVIGRRA